MSPNAAIPKKAGPRQSLVALTDMPWEGRMHALLPGWIGCVQPNGDGWTVYAGKRRGAADTKDSALDAMDDLLKAQGFALAPADAPEIHPSAWYARNALGKPDGASFMDLLVFGWALRRVRGEPEPKGTPEEFFNASPTGELFHVFAFIDDIGYKIRIGWYTTDDIARARSTP